MTNGIKHILLFACILAVGCAPKVKSSLQSTKYAPLGPDDVIFVLEGSEEVPNNSTFVGDIKIGDSGFSTDCGYNTVMEKAKQTAQKAGANIIQITEMQEPNMASTCYRIKAKLYRNSHEADLSAFLDTRRANNKSRLPEDADYAMIYFYRPPSYVGSLIGFKIRLDDKTEIGRVRNGEKFAYKTSLTGNQTFWAVTESPSSIKINIEKGHEYFVRCSITMGVMVGRPKLELVKNQVGIHEYDKISDRSIRKALESE